MQNGVIGDARRVHCRYNRWGMNMPFQAKTPCAVAASQYPLSTPVQLKPFHVPVEDWQDLF